MFATKLLKTFQSLRKDQGTQLGSELDAKSQSIPYP